MTTIDHVTLYTSDLEAMSEFWRRCFEAVIGERYESRRRPGFVSRFATLPGGARIEIMSAPWVTPERDAERRGWDHVALSLGNRDAVDAAVQRANNLNYEASSPRLTGDGFYEAVIQATDGIRIEVTI